MSACLSLKSFSSPFNYPLAANSPSSLRSLLWNMIWDQHEIKLTAPKKADAIPLIALDKVLAKLRKSH